MIGITLGDPAGIGPEITLKALPRFAMERITLIGSKSVLGHTIEKLQLPVPSGVAWVDIKFYRKIKFGEVQRAAGRIALRSLEVGVEMLKRGELDGLVTAPVSKGALYREGFEFPGQTEFLATHLGARHHAMLAYAEVRTTRRTGDGRRETGGLRRSPVFGLRSTRELDVRHSGFVIRASALRIVFVTIHLPLAEVPREITAIHVEEKIRLLDEFLRHGEHIRSPKIAVLALNPHAWEFTLGEEIRIANGIRRANGSRLTAHGSRPSAVRRLPSAPHADGPFPADSIPFLLEKYDGIVAMYHDQAMIPAKLLSGGRGVNVTLGLPRPRTSPLHGTAFDIAGKGIASPASMEAAIELCLRLTANR
jgi:4-hydroxythreonine-4-phosphate dehydrogenase